MSDTVTHRKARPCRGSQGVHSAVQPRPPRQYAFKDYAGALGGDLSVMELEYGDQEGVHSTVPSRVN